MKLPKHQTQSFWVVVLLCVLTWSAFWPIAGNGFVRYDDPQYVTENPHVLSGLTAGNVAWALQAGYANNWHPLTWLSHMLDVELFGLSPGWHHLASLLLHTANVALLFLVFQFLTGATWRSALVAALFAVHPLHVESVAWVSERKDLLSTFFLLAMLWAYGAYAKSVVRSPKSEAENQPTLASLAVREVISSPWYWVSVGLFALGLMSKPMLVTAPFVLLLLDYWPLGRFSPQSSVHNPQSSGGHDESAFRIGLLLEKLPFLALAAVSSVITFRAQQTGGSVSILLPLGPRVSNAVASYLKYLGKTFWPADLSVFYPHPDTQYPISHQWPFGVIVLAALLLAAVSAAAILCRKRAAWFPVGWFWFLGSLVPVIGIVQVGAQAMADRYTYIPLIGIFVCVAWGGAEIVEMARRSPAQTNLSGPRLQRLPWTVAVIALVACAGLTLRQTLYWRNDQALFSHALEVSPNNAVAHCHLGTEAGEQGDYTTAIEHFQAALKADPACGEANYGLAYTYQLMGRTNEALEQYQAALRLRPGLALVHSRFAGLLWQSGRRPEAVEEYALALRLNPEDPVAHYHLGFALASAGNFAQADMHFAEAIRLQPQYVEAYRARGHAFLRQGKPAEAAAQLGQALQLSPDAQTFCALGLAQKALGQTKDAVTCFREALKLNRDYIPALTELAWVLATSTEAECRNGAEAVQCAERAQSLSGGQDLRVLTTLDAAYAEAGRFSEAAKTAERVRELAKAAGDLQAGQSASERLTLYQKQQPFRAPAR